jgi:hypothetical protein
MRNGRPRNFVSNKNNLPAHTLRKKPSEPDIKKESPHKGVILPTVVGSILGNLIIPGIGGVVLGGLFGVVVGTSSRKEKVMAKVPVFYSFHFDNDVMRVQQIRNIGSIEGNSPTTPNEWEKLKRTGKQAVENWIDQNMKYKRCVIVLIGSETARRPWVEHEIIKAWNDGRALIGIHIHNIKCPRNGTSRKGSNPFDFIKLNDGRKLSDFIPCYDPSSADAYRDIANNITDWIDIAIKNKAN